MSAGPVLLQHLPVHPGSIVETLEMADADQPQQVVIALIILGQQDKMIRLIIARGSIRPAARRDVPLDADDRLDPCLLCLAIEIDDAVQAPVVSQGKGLKSKLARVFHKVGNAAQAVQQAEL